MQSINIFELPNYDLEFNLCTKFLKHKDQQGEQKLISHLAKIANREEEILNIFLDDVGKVIDLDFAQRVEENVIRYTSLFYDAADFIMPAPKSPHTNQSRADVFLSSRLKMAATDSAAIGHSNKKIPKDLTRTYEIIVHPFKKSKSFAVREVKSEHIGKLTKVRGMATRITNVRPLIFVATYTCDACGHEFYKSVRSKEFTPMAICENDNCTSSEKIFLQTRGSRFLKFQQLTIQETPETVPFGGIPRTMSINLRSSNVRKCVAGDIVTVSGVFLPTQYSGFKQMRAGLTAATSFEGTHLERHKKSYCAIFPSNQMRQDIQNMASQSSFFDKLARSIAPEIYGLLDVKKALLLLMVGGATKSLPDGITIRGDINIILMGDPGVAKSQLLKHISVIAPRAVYTTGKGSSGVGLTAAVIRDSVTDEMVLEGGALVMADMGVCCIDEFDKMEESDRTSIHEVMEQQTVSISKAGICTTLNARTSVLAAANPAYGRYDKNKSPEANIVLPAALMSRFDLMFVLIDECSDEQDIELAGHICYVHQNAKPPELDFDPVSPDFLRAYISVAKTFEPMVSKEVVNGIVETYLQLRSEGRESDAKRLLPTPRTLLSILRLSQAHARLRLSNEIVQKDIDEATRLIYKSQSSMYTEEEREQNTKDKMAAVFAHIKDYLQIRSQSSAKVSDLMNSLKMRGFSPDMVHRALDHYMELDVWMVNKARTKLSLVE